MHDEHRVPIWFFIGSLLALYGLLIFGSGLFNLISPPPPDQRVTLYELHADIWWGVIMMVVGVYYVLRFHPTVVHVEGENRDIEALEKAPY